MAERLRLLCCRHEEIATSGSRQRCRHRTDTEAITVCFDRSAAGRPVEPDREPAVVVGEGAEIDGDPASAEGADRIVRWRAQVTSEPR